MMESVPKFLNGVFAFKGGGLGTPALLDPSLVYSVPSDRRSQLVSLRAGNSADALVSLTLMRDGKPMRLFPVGAKAAEHVPLTVVEDLQPDTKLEVHFDAPEGVSGHLVIDLGMVEI